MPDSRHTVLRTFPLDFAADSFPVFVPPAAPDWHQLIYAQSGLVLVTAARQSWLLPPHRALWVPAGSPDATLEPQGDVALRMLYVRVGPRQLPTGIAVVNVNPLLRELILRVNTLGACDSRNAVSSALHRLILHELRTVRSIPLQLPLPADPRALRFAANAALSGAASLGQLVRQSGASRRTLERLFLEETGLSLGRWLRRRRVLLALSLLNQNTVASVAGMLGYASPSAFIAMFRQELGETPARYLSENA